MENSQDGFDEGMKLIREVLKEMKELYLNDEKPWVIGFSGGKDSTCVVQLVFRLLEELPSEKRHKKIHIVSNDTLVENPILEKRISKSLKKMREVARKKDLPIVAKKLKPKLEDTFWVNIIGRGYPCPNRWFRWCTDRLKIKPTTSYIEKKVEEQGEVIVVLGARKEESASRAQTMDDYSIPEYNLRGHSDINRAFIYTPIEDWSSEEVWDYLNKSESTWGGDNQELMKLYKKAEAVARPMQIDKSTPPTSGGRFGCWTCTVVGEDKSSKNLIESGEEWLEPLLEFRNWLKEIRNDSSKRQSMRKNDQKRKIKAKKMGREFNPTERGGHQVQGPFTFETRYEILSRLMELQEEMTDRGIDIQLISPQELKAIETIWIYEGADITSITEILDLKDSEDKNWESGSIHEKESKVLEEVSKKYDLSPELIERLLIVENDLSNLSRRTGIYKRLDKIIESQALKEFEEE